MDENATPPREPHDLCKHGHSLADAYLYERTYTSRKTGAQTLYITRVCRECARLRGVAHSRKIGQRARPTPVMPTDKVLLAYAAGIFDGEGSVGIRLIKKKGATEAKYHSVTVSITSTDTALTDWLQCHFGGRVNQNHRENADRNYKDAWKWLLLARHAAAFLEAIRPYLIVKAHQARVALELRDLVGAGRATPVTPELFARREALRLELKALNRRGRPADTESMVPA
jgi:hypothetical protein